jgi:periodic tryptophan protein 2
MAHYRFNNLLGAPYRGGNLCLRGHHLISSVGNRVSEVDLQLSSSTTLPCENLTEIRCAAVSPSGHHMLSFDTDGRAILVNVRCVLARHSLRARATTRFPIPRSDAPPLPRPRAAMPMTKSNKS